MKIACYTSCSINYLAKARVLASSLRLNNPEANLVLCLNDTMPEWLDPCTEPFDDIWSPTDLGYSESWIFQHDIMELCTAVKGRALKRLMTEYAADLYAYFDPDVCVYGSLEHAAEQMQNCSIGLVPHITEPEVTNIGVRMTEMSVTHHGIYNLGHLFVKNDKIGQSLANWWTERLDMYCFNDPERGLFTDQRWMDLVPSIFDSVRIMREPNLDVASWNVCGRRFSYQAETGYRVTNSTGDWPLLTYHFSGTGIHGVHHRVRNTFNPCDIALASIEKEYEEAIEEQGQSVLCKHPFEFDFFDNGVQVTSSIRKFYRNNLDLIAAFPKPFKTDGSGQTLYRWLQENRPDLVSSLRIPKSRLNSAFKGIFDSIFYLEKYSEVNELIEKGLFRDATDHYIRFGSANNYDPSLYFDSSYYYEKAQYHMGHKFAQGRFCNEPIEATVLWHYIEEGLPNRIEPNCYFDSQYYIDNNPDVCAEMRLGLLNTPLEHFQLAGDAERRQPSLDLNLHLIYQRNSEVAQLIDSEVTRGVVESLIFLERVSKYECYDIELDDVELENVLKAV